jgi:2-polyprenyl-3-methyl-5-hydroxy-6-metoxy-1,4-benzoquinol methylase
MPMSKIAVDRLTDEHYWDNVWKGKTGRAWNDLQWTRRGYNRVAWDRILRRRLRRAPEKRFLEVGCGTAKWLIYYHTVFGHEVTGCDYSEAACTAARQSLKRAGIEGTMLQQDLFTLTGRYDVVASHGLIEHFAAPEEVLAKLVSLLNPRGTLVSTVPNVTGLSGLYHRLFKPETFTTHRTITLAQLRDWYESLGLENVEVGALGSFVPSRFPRGAIRRRHPRLYRVLWAALLGPVMWFSNQFCLRLFTHLGIRLESQHFSPVLYAIGSKREAEPGVVADRGLGRAQSS